MDRSNWKTARDLIQMVRKKMKQCVQKMFCPGAWVFLTFSIQSSQCGGNLWCMLVDLLTNNSKKSKFPQTATKKNMWFSNMWLLAMDGEFDAWALVVLWCRLTIAENSWVSEPQAETDEVVEWMAEPAGGRVNGVWLLVNTQICKQIGTSKCKWCFVWPACTGDILPVLAALLAVFGKALFVDRFWNFNLLLLVGLWSCCTLIQYNMQTWSWLIIYSNHFFGHSDFPKKYWGIAVNTVVFHETTENEFVVSALLKETCLWVKFEYLVVIPKCRLSPTTLLPRLRNPAFLQRLNVEKKYLFGMKC